MRADAITRGAWPAVPSAPPAALPAAVGGASGGRGIDLSRVADRDHGRAADAVFAGDLRDAGAGGEQLADLAALPVGRSRPIFATAAITASSVISADAVRSVGPPKLVGAGGRAHDAESAHGREEVGGISGRLTERRDDESERSPRPVVPCTVTHSSARRLNMHGRSIGREHATKSVDDLTAESRVC